MLYVFCLKLILSGKEYLIKDLNNCVPFYAAVYSFFNFSYRTLASPFALIFISFGSISILLTEAVDCINMHGGKLDTVNNIRWEFILNLKKYCTHC